MKIVETCSKLKSEETVRLLSGEVATVDVNDRRLMRLQLKKKWVSYLKVQEVLQGMTQMKDQRKIKDRKRQVSEIVFI